MRKEQLDKESGDTREFIETFSKLFLTKRRKKPFPVFTAREIMFLTRLLLYKENDLILFSIADFLADKRQEGVRVFANGASFRRLEFYRQFIMTRGNATRSAILAGYSRNSAKQQGHRLLRWIQRCTGQDIRLSGFKGHQK